jgi:protein-S-isoprenylcysteine O-methyltransferase Ste14
MMRLFWNALGWIVHGLFAVTVYYLFWFLYGVDQPAPTTTARALAIDGFLAGQFALWHSALLLPATRTLLTRWIPSPAYGVCYCGATCVLLLTVIGLWQPCGHPLWHAQGSAEVAVRGGFYGCWVMLFYSLYFSGYGNQTGWTSWWPWVRGLAVPKRIFQPRAIYLWLRHPVYLSFLGLVWFVPCMTIDRAALTAVWTVYVFVGSYLKDRRMVHYLGMSYREYQAQVPGYPLMLAGPLGRPRLPRVAEEAVPVA